MTRLVCQAGGVSIDTPAIPTRAIIYCRISRDREGAGLGVERQLEDCRALAEQLGLDIVEIYEDNDLSAYSGKPRPGYLALLQDLRDGRANVVLAWHTDRLHRSPAELEQYIDVCEPKGVQTRTVKAGHLDLSTATGRMIARQLGVQARYEVERMVERQKRARDQMAKMGKHFGGRRPFGWEVDGMTPIDFEFECIREAAKAVLAGASSNSIAEGWRARGVKTSTGVDWIRGEVSSMLLRPRNAGIVVHRGELVGEAQWPAPLDEATWRSVVAILSDPSRRTTPGGGRKHLGSGLYVCGVCGLTVSSATANSRSAGSETRYWAAYRCKSRKHLSRQANLLDDYVQLLVIERISRPDAAELLVQREDPVDVRQAQTDIREARQTLDELASALGSRTMDMRSYQIAAEIARKDLSAAEGVLAKAVKLNPIAGLVGVEDPETAWNRLDLSRKRAVISYLMTVTLLPARKGRQKGGGYWDAESVCVEWK